MEDLISKIMELGVSYGGKLLLALIVLVVGTIAIRTIKRLVDKTLDKDNVDRTLQSVLKNSLNIALYALLGISIIEILGVPMSSVMALIASCGLAIGLALQGALTNFAGGLMIILFKPFRVGDYIECSGAEGIVKDISIFYTIIVTLDNIRISVPNGDLMNSAISNYSIEKIRRIDLDFKVTNDCDGDEAREVLLQAATNTTGILHEPKPFTRLSAVDDDTYIYTVRVWVDADKYWDVYFDVLENCSKALNENGIDDPEERIAVRIVKEEK